MLDWRHVAVVLSVLMLALGSMQPVSRARAGMYSNPEDNGTSIPAPNVEPPAFSTVILPSAGAEDANGLPNASAQPGWTVGDLSGDYRIASTGTVTGGAFVVADGNRANVSVAADARLVVDNNTAHDAILRLGCRYQTSGSAYTGYILSYSPSGNDFSLDRFDQGVDETLTGVQYLTGAAFFRDPHHLLLTCSGDTLSASIDGKQVGSVHDGAYADGEAMVGVGMFTRDQGFVPPTPAGSVYPGPLDARFRDLSFSQPQASGSTGP